MKCDFCGLPNLKAMFACRVTVGTPWLACQECYLLIRGEHFLALVQRAVAAFVAPRAVADPAIITELRRQTERWLHDQFWSRRDGIAYPVRRS